MSRETLIYRGLVQLADGNPHSALGMVVEGPKINGQTMLDVEPYIFASKPTIFPRGGDVEVITFTIARQHATEGESLDVSLRHGRTVRGVETLVIQFAGGLWQAQGAGWEATDAPAPEGYASAMRYRVLCPEIVLLEAPEDGPADADLVGALDGGDDDLGDVQTDDWHAPDDDDGVANVVATFDAEEDAA